jgi:hypothetical protein
MSRELILKHLDGVSLISLELGGIVDIKDGVAYKNGGVLTLSDKEVEALWNSYVGAIQSGFAI